ncbi:MAG TPA: glycosyltransferase [Acidimicrobiales bacterium]
MRISVVTPTLESAHFLRTCAASIRMQSAPGLEVEHIVVDSGSTDGTAQLASELGCTVRSVEPGTGIFAATNIGTRASDGDLVGYLGADDVLFPGALDAVGRTYHRSGRRWVTGSYHWVDEQFRPLGTLAAPPQWLTSELHASLGWSFICHMATYFERSLFDEIGGFDPAYRASGDYKFFTEALHRTPFARVAQPVAAFRRHGANVSMVDPAVVTESQLVTNEYGPSRHSQRLAYQAWMKAYVNLRNPMWAYRKRRPLPAVTSLEPARPATKAA